MLFTPGKNISCKTGLKFRFVFIPVTLCLVSCNPTKKLKQGEYILDKVEVEGHKTTGLPKENFEAFIRQKPNRKFLRKVDFFVWWYNLFSDEKIKRKREERNLRYDKKNADKVKRFEKKNEKRGKKGKKPKTPHLKDKESSLLIESIRDIGEPAVIFDSTLAEQTRFQLNKYLFSKGFFDNRVRDTILLKQHRKRAQVKYILEPKKPYLIKDINYQMDDKELGKMILNDTLHSLIKKGANYDLEKFQLERQRITDMALNNGYYFFENAYLNFDVDSFCSSHTVNVSVHLKKFSRAFSSNNDSLVYTNHARLKVENVYVITEVVIGNIRDAAFKDTIRDAKTGLQFLLNKPLSFRKTLLMNNIDIYKGQLFKRDTAQQTYKQLLGLGVFRNVTIQFLVNRDNPNGLDCYIICVPLLKQSITAETEGTNTSGNLGVDGSLLYQNRNFFKGGELVELKMQGALSAQTQFNTEEENAGTLSKFSNTFNTLQLGPEFTFAVPRAFFPFSLLPFKKDMSPRTYVKSSFNYQARPQFNRIITSIDYGFNFKTHNNTLRHDIVPFEAYFVKAKLTNSFKDLLAGYNDAFLANSFQDHITTLSKYSLTYLSKENSNTSRKVVNYVRWSIQSSGNILRKIYDATGHQKDSLNRYLIYGIPFAQFIRTDVDYRIYIPIRKKSRVVYRLAGGIGKPLTNLNVLPYEQSFFSGGPNSNRAWRARTLGPGGYNPGSNTARYDKIGDILLEGNVEYRFHIIKSFNGALFADAGNIWRLKPDVSKPNAEFLFDRFIDQFALGGGFGIRWDLDFFVLRLDLASPLHDPKYESGNRWTFTKQPWNQVVANFGIGYPF